jgi:(p)ppGpp synthase/HD superfamily hydrolase
MLNAGRLSDAIKIAESAHAGQLDKIGRPYISHCRRVADKQPDEERRTIAYLHDVAERAPGWTLTRLMGEGFSPGIITAVDALTRRMGETDDAFLRRAISNPLARAVKKADLEDNLAQMREKGGNGDQYERGLRLIDASPVE